MRRITLFTLVALLALGTGCDTSEKETAKGGRATGKAKAAKKRPGERLREAVARTRRTSVRVEETITVRHGTEEGIATIKGSFDFARDRGELSVALPGTGRRKETFSEGKVFMSPVPGRPRGTRSVTDRAEAKAHAPLTAPLNDPEYVLEQISQLRKVSYEGATGYPPHRAYRYAGWLDFDTATHRLDRRSRAVLERARPAIGDYPVWAHANVTEDGCVERIELTSILDGTSTDVAIDFTDHGTPVTVTPPKTIGAQPG
ncbi:hypothetical protein [Streptomyces cucumeris]|uniref:hypothetical protein n=1 Tax=Streptomyces cucumeris TaxID=2962890 RepID=UPI0020C8EF8B|nr:hypothetical protein [Streptomyces sp. NEAU-Y11]MCP9208735.1 hypothetical protein [Streptomyces sp. NEAU-Y11]